LAENSLEQEMEERFKGAKKVVVLAVGDELDPRDCLGYLAGKRLSSLGLRNVDVLITSQMPENYTSEVKRLKPSHVLIIDAAEMGGSSGDVAFIDSGGVAATRVSTHAMPLSVLMMYLEKELKVDVALIGIQPAPLRELDKGSQPQSIERGIERIIRGLEASVR
jgi:hydrogenase 3 maturation protease